MPETLNLTKTVIDGLPLPAAGKRVYYADAKERGLQLCITSTGARSWYFVRWAAGTSQRVRIGEYPSWTREQAQKKAAELNGLVARGEDPSAPARREREQMTFADLHAWYMETYSKPRKRSWRNDQWAFDNHLAHLARLPLRRVTRALVRETHAAIAKKKTAENRSGGPVQANRTLALISVMFTCAIADELFDGANPATGIEAFPEESRDRRLTAAELPRLLIAIEEEKNETVRDAVMLLLLTGQRKGELLGMRWADVDFGENEWRIPMTMNGRPQLVPLEEAELEILLRRWENSDGSEWVFPGRRDTQSGHIENIDDGWTRIRNRAGLSDLRLHDLRRSLGSLMADAKVPLNIIGKTLNHKSVTPTLIYARLSLDPVREAKGQAHEIIKQARQA